MVESTMERRLAALGDAMTFGRAESLADDVLAALDADRAAASLPERGRRRLLLAAAVLLVAIAGTVAAVPDSRHAVARWLGFESLRIERVDRLPESVPSPVGPPVRTEPTLSIEAAGAAVGVVPRVADGLGPPRSVSAPAGRYVEIRYDDAGREVLVATLPGTLQEGWFGKFVDSGVTVDEVTVGAQPAFWISGSAHIFVYRDGDGDIQESRPAADTLVWQDGDVIVRVEGDIPLVRALEIASTLHEP